MPATPERHLTAVMLMAAIAGLTPVAPAVAAEGAERSLCDLLPITELHAIAELRYGEPEFGDDTFCFYETSADQTGPHSVNLDFRASPFAIPFEELRESIREQNPAIEDVLVAGQSGFVDTSITDVTSLTIGLGDRLLSVIVSVGASSEAGDLDPVTYVLEIGAILVPQLLTSSDEPGSGSSSPAPSPDAGGPGTPRSPTPSLSS